MRRSDSTRCYSSYNREFKKTTTETETSLNKSLNEQHNGWVRFSFFINMQIKKICVRVCNHFKHGRCFNSFFIGFLNPSTTETRIRCSDRVRAVWIINEFENFISNVSPCPRFRFVMVLTLRNKGKWLQRIAKFASKKNHFLIDVVLGAAF